MPINSKDRTPNHPSQINFQRQVQINETKCLFTILKLRMWTAWFDGITKSACSNQLVSAAAGSACASPMPCPHTQHDRTHPKKRKQKFMGQSVFNYCGAYCFHRLQGILFSNRLWFDEPTFNFNLASGLLRYVVWRMNDFSMFLARFHFHRFQQLTN